jgi:hypothetical protein
MQFSDPRAAGIVMFGALLLAITIPACGPTPPLDSVVDPEVLAEDAAGSSGTGDSDDPTVSGDPGDPNQPVDDPAGDEGDDGGGDPVDDPNEAPAPVDPLLSVDQGELDFSWEKWQTSFRVANAGGGTLAYSISADVDWVALSSAGGSVTDGEDLIQVDIDRAALAPGDYSGTVVIEAADGQREELPLSVVEYVSAADWGFDPEDSTHAIQGAIDSGASAIVIPNMGQDWIVRPINLVSDQEVYFEPGVVVLAKEGEFHGVADCLVQGSGVSNVLLYGYDATLRMRKADYLGPDYEYSQWRHCLYLKSSNNISVYGLSFEDSGGDGIYIGPTLETLEPCRDVVISDVVCDGNCRQGISVTSGERVLVENCVLRNAQGCGAEAGIDIEPNRVEDVLRGITVKGCLMEDNVGTGIGVALEDLSPASPDVSIRIENCTVRGSQTYAVQVRTNDEGPPPAGLVELINCSSEGTGLYVTWAGDWPIRLRFVNCDWLFPWDEQYPVRIQMPLVEELSSNGRVEFVDCTIRDSYRRYCMLLVPLGGSGEFNVAGAMDVFNPHGSLGWVPPPELDVDFFME